MAAATHKTSAALISPELSVTQAQAFRRVSNSGLHRASGSAFESRVRVMLLVGPACLCFPLRTIGPLTLLASESESTHG